MELTYTADWVEHSDTSSTLTIGTYYAHVYRYPHESTWRFWVRQWLDSDESESEQVAHGTAADATAARTAAENEIRTDHEAA